MRERFDSSFAGPQSARSRGVSSNRQRRLTRCARSQAGDPGQFAQTCFGGSLFGNLNNICGRGSKAKNRTMFSLEASAQKPFATFASALADKDPPGFVR